MKKIIFFVFLSCGCFLSMTCQQKTGWKGSIDEVDGVLVISNPQEPLHENAMTLKEELTIGQVEEAGEFVFSAVGLIDVNDEGNIFVADAIESDIKVFDHEGRFLRTIGKKGQGPGEFSRIDSLRLTPEGQLVVMDNVSRRLSYFTTAGELADSRLFEKLPPASSNWQADSRGNVVMDTARFTESGLLVVETQIYDSQLQFVKTLDTPKTYDLSKPFSPFHYWQIAANDSLVYAFNDTYELQVFSPAWELVKKIRRDAPSVKVSRDEIEEELKRKRLPPDTNIPEYHPAFHVFVVDDDGKIYVRTWEQFENGDLFFFDIFGAEGKYITRFPFHVTPKVIKKEKLYTVEGDEQGFHIIKRYRILWTYE